MNFKLQAFACSTLCVCIKSPKVIHRPMYCKGCGEQLEESSAFCHICGLKVTVRAERESTTISCGHETTYLNFRKSSGVALLLGILLTGGGQFYAGKTSRGLAIMLFGVLLAMSSVIALVIMFFEGVNLQESPGTYAVLAITSLFLILFWLWTLYDAHKLVEEYNDTILRTGRPPW